MEDIVVVEDVVAKALLVRDVDDEERGREGCCFRNGAATVERCCC